MSLAINYCKEIARELKQIAVYRPGTAVAPGDIIGFDKSTLFGVPKPLGDFKKIGSLSDFDIKLETETDQENELDSYVFGSKGSVSVSFEAGAVVGDVGKGKLKIGFSKEGSTYLSALDCKETRFKSIIALEDKLKDHSEKIEWQNFFIVISVTVAAKALIMQSNTSTASLELEGDVKNLMPTNQAVRDLSANLSLKTNKYSEASFLKDWSNNVPVFFKLVRYRRRFLGDWDLKTKGFSMIAKKLQDQNTIIDNPYNIREVDPSDFIDSE